MVSPAQPANGITCRGADNAASTAGPSSPVRPAAAATRVEPAIVRTVPSPINCRNRLNPSRITNAPSRVKAMFTIPPRFTSGAIPASPLKPGRPDPAATSIRPPTILKTRPTATKCTTPSGATAICETFANAVSSAAPGPIVSALTPVPAMVRIRPSASIRRIRLTASKIYGTLSGPTAEITVRNVCDSVARSPSSTFNGGCAGLKETKRHS